MIYAMARLVTPWSAGDGNRSATPAYLHFFAHHEGHEGSLNTTLHVLHALHGVILISLNIQLGSGFAGFGVR